MDGDRRKCNGNYAKLAHLGSHRFDCRSEYICLDDHECIVSSFTRYGYHYEGSITNNVGCRPGSNGLFYDSEAGR